MTSELKPREGQTAVLALILLVTLFNYMDRQVLSVLLGPISKDLGLSDTQIGLIAGLPFALLYAFSGLPFSRIADRCHRPKLIALAVAGWSLATVACGLAYNFLSLFLLRMGVGIGEGAGTPASHSVLADYVSPERRAFAASLLTVAAAIGGTLGYILGGSFVEYYGWRLAFVFVGGPGMLVAALVYWMLPEKRTNPSIPKLSNIFGSETLQTIKRLWSLRSFRLLVLGFTLCYLVAMGIGQWAAVFASRAYGLGEGQIGLSLGLASGLPPLGGAVVGGFAADRLAKNDVRWLLLLPALCSIAMLPGMLGFILIPSWSLALLALGLAAFSSGAFMGPVFASIYALAGSTQRATGIALVAIFTNILGMGFGPILVGALSDVLAPSLGHSALQISLVAVTILLIPSALALFFAAQRLPADIKASTL